MITNAEIFVYFIELLALSIIVLVCAVGFFRTKHIHMMGAFLALGFICAVLLKAILP